MALVVAEQQKAFSTRIGYTTPLFEREDKKKARRRRGVFTTWFGFDPRSNDLSKALPLNQHVTRYWPSPDFLFPSVTAMKK